MAYPKPLSAVSSDIPCNAGFILARQEGKKPILGSDGEESEEIDLNEEEEASSATGKASGADHIEAYIITNTIVGFSV